MIKKVRIKNFKSIDDLTIEFNRQFNVIIGENNIGKTTIFEAIRFWKMCYDINVTAKKKKFYSVAQNMPFRNMESIRVFKDSDLFSNITSREKSKLEIEIELLHDEQSYKLGFIISKPNRLEDSYLQIQYIDKEEFERFSNMVISAEANLSSFIVIEDSKPIASILAKEPYLYRGQIRDKLAKGKKQDVLRNRVIENLSYVQNNVNTILETDYVFKEFNQDDKTYIDLRVNDKNLLSFGSGFLQLCEIFSSIRFENAKIHIFLIDEPDSHLHLKIQKKLITELKSIENIQTFIITHNERFIKEAEENEIIYISQNGKETGSIKHIATGSKLLVVEDLSGVLTDFEKIPNSDKIIIVEGKGDRDFLTRLAKIRECSNIPPIIQLDGIDTIVDKLKVLINIVGNDKKLIIIRDTDFIPIDKIEGIKNKLKDLIPIPNNNISILFQNGYGIESVIFASFDILNDFISKHYSIDDRESISEKTTNIRDQIFAESSHVLSDVYKELSIDFSNQKQRRKDQEPYKKLEYQDFLKPLEIDTLHFLMNKKCIDEYFKRLETDLNITDSSLKVRNNNLLTKYLDLVESGNVRLSQDFELLLSNLV